ncbi:MAG: efflux RND transporter periplasmic adaptor subunit [candidate division WS1 bacterium]|jgi:HlyD family secretion protein|nr:efflux RND transporter periplasmic adaptor subunit [candidate division WS1 bacterium]
MKRWIVIIAVVAIVGGTAWWYFRGKQPVEEEEEMSTVAVERGDLRVTVAATGVLEPLTTVEVKSRSGGEIDKMYVEAGDYVQAGDLIAQLDPTDLQTAVDEAAAQVDAANARVAQAGYSADAQGEQTVSSIDEARASVAASRARLDQSQANLEQTRRTSEQAVEQARARLASARARLEEARAQEEAQPELTRADIRSAEAALDRAKQDLAVLEEGTRPQEIAQAQARVSEAQAVLSNARNELTRVESLHDRGFVSDQDLDSATRSVQTAEAQLTSAREALSLAQAGPRVQEIERARAAVRQAEAALASARAQDVQVNVRSRSREAAEAAVTEAQSSLRTAEAQRRQVDVREGEVEAARRAVDQAEAGLDRAQAGRLSTRAQREAVTVALADLRRAEAGLEEVQYNFTNTTVVAPRDGVILTKHVEEGTVVPAGTAALAQGTAIVTIADITEMYVMANVDEVDISRIAVGQPVEINVETLPNERITGEVEKIFPQGAETENVVYFPVRIRVIDLHSELRPGMTVDVSVLTAERQDVLIVPDSAIDRSGGKTVVQVLPEGAEEPVDREVEVGVTDWENTEIISGVEEGETVVLPMAGGFGGNGEGGPGGPGARGENDTRRNVQRTTRMIGRTRN